MSESSDLPPSPTTSLASLEYIEFDDPSLTSAKQEAIRTATLTPLLKHELRLSIQNRRLKKGKDELVVSLEPKEADERLTPEELKRRQIRRERNRVAAQKCRMKRRNKASQLMEESEELAKKQENLLETIELLQKEKETLVDLLKSHHPFCSQAIDDEQLFLSFTPIKKPRLDSASNCSGQDDGDTDDQVFLVLHSDTDNPPDDASTSGHLFIDTSDTNLDW